ncbi:MAG: hypothetical protein ACOYOL_00705 [Chthoniobacterales bacterium]
MTHEEEASALRAHARRWAEAGPELAKLRDEALRSQTEEQHRQAVLDVLSGPIEWFVLGSQPWSGLVEQQRIFREVCKT